jgi:UDP-N-acetylmuramoyl-tripeptide--D-alanyl-D-alanine ligase
MPSYSPDELARWSGGQWKPHVPKEVAGVSNDTRTISEGDVYVALKGENFDGHDFVKGALEGGAVGAVVSREQEVRVRSAITGEVTLLSVADTGRALIGMGSGYRAKIDPKIVAITGSSGKSTVKEMTAQILRRAVPTACTRGNYNNNIGLPLSLLSMAKNTEVGVFELGTNHPGEIADLCDIAAPTFGVLTNVGSAHIEFFGSVEAIAREKASLFESLPADGAAVLNQDSEFAQLFHDAASCDVITISTQGEADYKCNRSSEGSVVVTEVGTGEEFTLRLSQPGEHNTVDAMLALAVARKLGVTRSDIEEGLANYKPLPMRWESQCIDGVRVINDAYNANPMSMRAAVSALEDCAVKGKLWLVLGGMMELGPKTEEEHLGLGRFIAEKMMASNSWGGLVTVGDLGQMIAKGAGDAGLSNDMMASYGGCTEASEYLAECTAPDDAVLLKASRALKLECVVDELSGRTRKR